MVQLDTKRAFLQIIQIQRACLKYGQSNKNMIHIKNSAGKITFKMINNNSA